MAEPEPRPGPLRIGAHMLAASAAPGAPVTIDLSSNESAFGPSLDAVAAAHAALARPERYHETAPQLLAEAIAACHDLPADRIVTGFGSDDLLARIARAYLAPGTELVRSRNGYLKVPNYAHANDAVPVDAEDKDFRASVEGLLACVTPRTRIVYLANPDNPSGACLTGAEVRRLHAGLPDDVLLVIDAAYDEYVTDPGYESPARLVAEAGNVVMTRTFSKVHGLAGMRVGWMFGPRRVCDVVARIGITFPHTTPALAAAMASLADVAHLRRVAAETVALRARFSTDLEASGVRVYPSEGNFVLARFPGPEGRAAEVFAALRARGIAARRFASPAYAGCIRFSIGLPHEMAATTAALRQILGEGI